MIHEMWQAPTKETALEAYRHFCPLAQQHVCFAHRTDPTQIQFLTVFAAAVPIGSEDNCCGNTGGRTARTRQSEALEATGYDA